MRGLYRAKDKKTGEWVEGCYVKYQPRASKPEWVHGIVPTYASALYIIEVDPETVCQLIVHCVQENLFGENVFLDKQEAQKELEGMEK